MVEQSGARLVLATAGWRGLLDAMLEPLAADDRPRVLPLALHPGGTRMVDMLIGDPLPRIC